MIATKRRLIAEPTNAAYDAYMARTRNTHERSQGRKKTVSADWPGLSKFRRGTYLPSLSSRVARLRRLLTAIVQGAYIQTVSTRSVDDLVKAMGMSGISKSRSAGCARISTSR